MKYLLRLIYGADELIDLTLELLAHRRAALKQYRENKEYAAKLVQGVEVLTQHKDAYTLKRQQLEGAYRLDLE